MIAGSFAQRNAMKICCKMMIDDSLSCMGLAVETPSRANSSE